MDAAKKRKGQPGYDPKTLYIPPDVYKALTPAQKQYFDIKAKNFDILLFYKIGKFYELYDLDAEVGVRELGLTYMVNQSRPHAGFPEAAYDKYSKMAVSLGHKVGRVEQTQTPKELEEANRRLKLNATNAGGKAPKASKIVERALCSVLTPGTLTDVDMIGSYQAASLFALVEHELTPIEIDELGQAGTRTALGGEVVCEYGVCWVDCATGQFTIGQFYDDTPRSQLATLLATVTPREVVVKELNLSDNSLIILRNELTPECYQQLQRLKEKDFLSASETYLFLEDGPYFRLTRPQPGADEVPLDQAEDDWPLVLVELTEQKKEQAFHALGGIIHMLEYTKNHVHLLSGKDFTLYTPSAGGLNAKSLILDTSTLTNLGRTTLSSPPISPCSLTPSTPRSSAAVLCLCPLCVCAEVMRDSEGSAKGSLLTYLDRCVNPMGHRQLKRWLSSPLADISAIKDRLNAVQYLRDDQPLREECQRLLRGLPDLERLISSLHAYSIKKEKTEVMYGQQEQRKLSQFVLVLDGLSKALEIVTRIFSQGYSREAFQSQELALCTVQFPRYDDVITEFKGFAEDWVKAKADGYITPKSGFIAAYDTACEAEKAAQDQLAQYLEEQREELRCPEVKFLHVNRDRFTLEIPARVRVSHDYTVVSGTAKVKRYYTPELKDNLLPTLEDAELNKEKIEKDATRLIYGKFVSYQVAWKRAIQAIASLDCLCSLASVSAEQRADGVTCRPDFIPFDEAKGPQLELKNCIHPVLAKHMPAGKGKTFIPNDIALGCGDCSAPIVLLSGANMGGPQLSAAVLPSM
jgi:DNA mismatch repair protein MSH6